MTEVDRQQLEAQVVFTQMRQMGLQQELYGSYFTASLLQGRSEQCTSVMTLNNVSELSLYSHLVLSETLLLTVVVQVQNVPKDQVKSEFDELHKECHLQKWYCLSEFENDLVGKSNQVLATEYSGYLLVYIGKI
jgi:hypothetical protein